MSAALKVTSRAVPPLTSNRRHRILVMLGCGLRNKEIGAQLGISEFTVKWYLQGFFDEFECDCRVQVVVHALKLGLITLEELS